ncbi:hypothetical protein VCHA34P129_30041 [Vibrio chagasii]|nr:hypothetical protein VCHA34P129_30041 [Vibrio chagasii]
MVGNNEGYIKWCTIELVVVETVLKLIIQIDRTLTLGVLVTELKKVLLK